MWCDSSGVDLIAKCRDSRDKNKSLLAKRAKIKDIYQNRTWELKTKRDHKQA